MDDADDDKAGDVSAKRPKGPKGIHSDHALLDLSIGDKVWCGWSKEAWRLNVSATPGGTAGSLKITFNESSDSVTFPMPANTSFSLTQEMGAFQPLMTWSK